MMPSKMPASEPPMIGAPAPPPQPSKPDPLGKLVAILLSLCLGLFLADAVVSLLDDSLILLFGIHGLAVMRGMLALLSLLMAILIYGLMGLTPMIPKRLFLPITLFTPVMFMAAVPFMIYFYSRIRLVGWGISLCQVLLALGILYRVQSGFKFRWPLIAESQLEGRRFGWRNLSVFLLVNAFVLPPAGMAYLALCAALAVNHFSDGFLRLRPEGLTVQARKYVRADGKTILLYPMAHVGDRGFYQELSESFPTNAIILLEGVTDVRNLLTNKITYQRVAKALGVTEQQEEFKPRGKRVRADVDVEVFNTNTIGFLNLAMLIQAKGADAEAVLKLLQFSPPNFEEQLVEDLLRKRNRHLLGEIRARLSEADLLIVPWGAAHMPEIASEIQKFDFRLDETREYVAIGFGSGANRSDSSGKSRGDSRPSSPGQQNPER